MWCTKILLVLSAAFVQSFCAADEHSGLPEMGMSIFLLVGQSNMSGRGELSDLREDDLLTSERIYTFTNSGNWAPAEFPSMQTWIRSTQSLGIVILVLVQLCSLQKVF